MHYAGRPVAAGSTPSNPRSRSSSASTNTSTARTGLLSSTQSSRHSGSNVACPRSSPATKPGIKSPADSVGDHGIRRVFTQPGLDQIIDLKHPLVALGRTVDWGFLEREFGAVYTDDPGRPPLPTRLMAGLAILKHTYDLSDEVLCEHWVENPYYQFFCGEEFFQHRLVFDRSSLTRWRNRMGEERLQALIQESLSVATRTKAIKPSELSRVIIDTTVQPKNVTFPTDAKLLNRAREKLAGEAPRGGFAPVLYAGGQVCPDPAPALCPCQAVQARQSDAQEAAHLTRPRHPRHRPQDRGRQRARSGVRTAAHAGEARARATAAPARAQGLFPACAGGRMHRQGQGPSALRVRRQGLRRHHPQVLQGRPVRHPCEGAARQSL